jgi:hypothetical protein
VLSESTTQFSTSLEAKRWLEAQTNAVLTPVQAKAKKLRDEMDLQIQALIDVSKQLQDVSNKEIERRNMKVYNRARALNKLAKVFLERLKKLSPPEHVSYDSMNAYVQETQKLLLVTDIDIKNWFPHISPFFIMDRRKAQAVYDKAKQVYNNLNDFVTKEYVKTKALEEALQQLNELQNDEQRLLSIQEDKDKTKNERLPIEQEIVALEKKMTELQSQGPIDKLNMVNAEIEKLNNELKETLRHFQKPFVKMQALATSGGGGGVTPDELQKINIYLDKPFEALAGEQQGYPVLKEILEKLEGMLDKDTLKLKPDKARKAKESINDFLHKNMLDSLQIRCKEMAQSRDHLLASSKLDETNRSLAQCQEQLVQLKARRTSVETHETVKANSYQATVDDMNSKKRLIEKNIYSALGKKVQIA